MKALSGGRPSQLQITSAHTCGLADCEHSLDHHDSRTPSYLLSPTESCPMEHRRCSPHSSIHSECMAMPVSVSMANTDHSISSSTFPRMHYSSHHDGSGSRDSGGGGGGGGGGSRDRDECGSSHGGSGKMNRIPANLLDQFEKQLPLHRDGFHTLQYQKTHTTTTEQRNESPGRIRHLVHSVQKLFTKSHSLEGSSKMNGTKGDSHREGSHHHHPNHHGHHKHSKRSKSKERKSSDSSGKQRSGVAGWWSSDDNLDSDSTYRTPSVMSRQQVDHISHCYPDSVHSHYGNLSLKTSKSNNDVKCSACESVAMAPEGKFMKRSSWSTLTVSQAKEAYRKSSLNLEKPMTPTDLKPNLRPCHYLQVPQDEWSGYPGGGKDDEIPCRRMRSSSYVKAMGDDESGESDSSPKTSPVKTVRPDALVKSVMQRPLLDSQSSYRVDKMNSDVRNYITNFAADLSHNYHLQASRDPHHPSMALEPSTNYNSQQPPLPAAQFRSRNQSYMRAVSTLSQASCVSQVSQVSETDINGQFESVCESVFSEVESQAVEALDLPGCFRTRSHSYLRAIQAGYSQDDDCIPTMTSSTVTSTIRSTTEGKYTQEATSLPEYQASVHRDVAGTGPLAHDDLGCPIRRDRLYRQESIGATAKPRSGPPVSPRLFRPPKASVQAPERPSPKAIQASIKESAQLAATISMQWKEEVSAMRRELSDLRRDLCTELRAFNSNFNSFTQHYNTWSPQPGASGGTGAAGKQTKVAQLSVGTQARSKVLVRQSTADAAVNCPEEGEMQEKQAIVRRRLPKQISMDPAILRRPASLFVEGSIPITLDPLLVDPVTMIQPESVPVNSSNTVVCPEPLDQNPERLSKLISPDGVSMSSSEAQSVDPAIEDPLDSEQLYPKALCSPDPVPTDVANVYLEETDKLDPVNLNPSDTESIDSVNVKPLVPEPRIMHLPYPVPVVTVSPPQESDSDSESVEDDTVRKQNPMSQDPVPVFLPDPKPLGPGPIVSTEPEIKPLSPTNVYSSEKLDQYSVTICPTVIVTPESPSDLEPLDVCLIPPDSESQDLATVCFPDLPDPIPLDLDIFSSEIVVHAYPVTIDSFDEFDDSLEPEWPPCPESEDQATDCPSGPFMVHLDLTTFNSSDESDLDSVFLDPPEPLETVSVSSSDLSPIAMYTPPDPVSLSPPSLDQTSIYQLESVSVDPAMEYRLDQMHEYLPTELPEDPEPQDQVTVHSPGLVSFGLDSPFTPDSVDLYSATMCHPEPVILGLDPLLLSQDPASISLSPFEMAPMEPEDATGEATDTSGMDVFEDPGDPEGETAPDNPGKSHCDQAFLWDRWQQKAPQWEPRSMKRSSSVELWSGRYEYNSAEITYMSLTL
ncbi:uncharacterized protein LOC129812690 isoform X1 [Salvelinus fontinalis]|uniref:uncharacterized protein LOC129812690 isoform X1 n=1 Tax=Salvelinus fontinalis TaxID=8038 RepID=UPI002484F92B|nr:uncharacterized protein LOC129812690 isoform X1 [Salvelinus fontinalis]XP_055720441.1 uncharacterized protein LOC129812690 isoform X1 [Salvelinus fontinalis]